MGKRILVIRELSLLSKAMFWSSWIDLNCPCKWLDAKISDSGNLIKIRKTKKIIEFSLNVVTKSICHYSKKDWTCHLLCKIPGCYHRARKTWVAERIFKLNPIHALVIYHIPWICWIHWIPDPFREKSIVYVLNCMYLSLQKGLMWLHILIWFSLLLRALSTTLIKDFNQCCN